MWFCFFPPLSKAIQEHYCYGFSSSKQSGKQNPLVDMDKMEAMATVLLPKAPPKSWSWKKATKRTKQTKKHYSALSETETKQCPLLAPAIEENSCLCRQILFFLALAVTGLCKQQDVHLQQRHRHTLETVLLSPRASPGLSDWL